MTAFDTVVQGLRTFFSDVAQGFFEITHNGFALVGLVVVFATAALTFKPELRITSEAQLITWLQARQADAVGMVADLAGIERATAADPRDLPKQQAAVAEAMARPIVIDAELRAQLAEVPVQCIKSMGGDPQSSDCFAATCWQFGQTGAQRPECGEAVKTHLDLLKKRESCVD